MCKVCFDSLYKIYNNQLCHLKEDFPTSVLDSIIWDFFTKEFFLFKATTMLLDNDAVSRMLHKIIQNLTSTPHMLSQISMFMCFYEKDC